MKKKGFALLQALVTALIVSVIAAGIIQVVLLRSTLQARVEQGNTAGQGAQSAFNAIMSAWNQNGGIVCSAVAGWGAGNPGVCNCTYTNGSVTVTTCVGAACNPAAPAGTCGLRLSVPLPQ